MESACHGGVFTAILSPCKEAWWSEREAANSIGTVDIPIKEVHKVLWETFLSCFAVLWNCCVFWNDKDVYVCEEGLWAVWVGRAYTHTQTHTRTHAHMYTGSEAERLSPLPPFDLCPQACLPARRCTVPRTLTPCSPATPHNCLSEISQGRLQTVLQLFH